MLAASEPIHQPDLTVVVVSYNVRAFLDHCLQSIARARGALRVQIIVVDNASGDGSAEMVAQRYPEVLLIANHENVGFGRANNQAFQRAQADAVLVLNPDSFVQEDTLQVLLDRLRQFPDVGAVGPKIILPDGRFEPRSMRGFPTPWAAFSYLTGLSTLFPRRPLFSRYLLTYLDPDQDQDVAALSGCCMMIRRPILQELGGFDRDYFMYGEDLDLCFRIRQQGYRILYTCATRIVHFKGESTRRSTIDHNYHFQRAMRLFVEKNLARRTSWLARQLITLGFFLREIERRLTTFFKLAAVPLADLFLLNIFIFCGRWIRFSQPGYDLSVWLVNGLYSAFYLGSGYFFGIYSTKKFSGRMALYAALVAGILSSALTYFMLQWAFSRLVVLGFALGMALALPAWRILLRRWVSRNPLSAKRIWVRRRALIIGTDELARSIAGQMAQDPGGELEPVGYVAFHEQGVGEVIAGVPVLGSVDELDSLIKAERIQEVLFSTAEASYERIIGMIQKLSHRSLNFRIIPKERPLDGSGLPLLRLELSSLRRSSKPSHKQRKAVVK